MASLDETMAAFQAARSQPQQPQQPSQDVNATPPGGGVDSAMRSFRAKRVTPNMGKVWDEQQKGTFQRSLDGDTVDLSRGKRRTSTRLAGIDTPESAQDLGPEAQAYIDEMVKNHGELKVGSKTTDKHGRNVSILYAGDKNLNVELVRKGLAKVYTNYLKNLSPEMQHKLSEAQIEAQNEKKGVWSDDYVAEDPEAYRRRVGSQNMAKGHDNRPPIDPSTRTISDSMRDFQAQRNPGAFQQRFGQGAANAMSQFKDGYETAEIQKRGITGKDKYVKEEGWLDHVFGALDYAGNMSRSGIKGAIEGKGGVAGKFENAKMMMRQARDKERHTSSTELKDTATEAAGLGKLRMGEDDGKFSIGDVGDFGTDFAIDVFTDPMTLVTAGFGSVASGGGKLAKALPGVHRGAVEARLGMMTPAAINWAKGQVATRAVIGSVYGAGAADADSDMSTKLLAAGAGAVLGASSGKGFDQASKLFKTGFDKASDWYAVTTRGSKFSDFSKARNVALAGYDKVRNIAESIRQGRFQALKELEDPVDKIRAAELMQTLKTEFIRRRSFLEQKVLQVDPGHPAYRRIANNFNKRVEASIEKDFLPALLEREKKDVADAVVAWGNHNTSTIRKLNKEAFGLEDGLPTKEGKGLVGIKWHTDDVYEKKNFKEAEGLLAKGAEIKKAESLSRSQAAFNIAKNDYTKATGKNLTEAEAKTLVGKDALFTKLMSDATDKSYASYTEEFAKKFLDETEQKANKFMQEFHDTAAKQTGVRGLETMLKGFDKVTNFAKANMLYFSMSWLKNNYFDNLAKSYVESGVHGIIDAATFGKLRNGVSEDVLDLYKNKMQRVYKNEDIQDAVALGVLDNPMFKSLADERTRAFLYTPDQIKAASAKEPLDLLKKGGEIWMNNPYIKTVQQVGSHMEGTARMMTYIRTKEALEASPVFKNAGPKELAKIKDIAADLTRKTFFDYSDVTHFENAVFKRIIPFYSFYSKNLPYWLKSAFDPQKVGRFLALEKARRNVGEDPTSYDKSGLSPYLLNSGARKLGRDERGDTKYGIFPSGSMYDAAKMINVTEPVQNLKELLIDKGHPHLKAVYELSSGNDLFDGQKLRPSDTKEGKKYLFSRGFKYAPLGLDSVHTQGGSPYTTSDTVVTVDKILSTLWPHGLVDQVAGSTGKVATGKSSLTEELSNRLSPMQTAKVSDAYARMVRNKKMEDKANAKADSSGNP